METLCREIPAPAVSRITGIVPSLVIGSCVVVVVSDGVAVELVMGVVAVAGRFFSGDRLPHDSAGAKALYPWVPRVSCILE